MRLAAAALAVLFLSDASALDKIAADKAVAAFVAAQGFTAMPEDLMDAEGSAYAARFRPDGGALRPDAEVGPVEKALLIVETMEKTQPDRVRYTVSYGQVTESDGQGGGDVISLVEIRRYNLGPLIREDVKKEYGPENTGGPEDFGIGPDVAWRFAFSPAMGNLALPLSISRRVIADGAEQLKTDAAELCPTGNCRDLYGVYEFDLAKASKKAGPFRDIAVPTIGTTPYSSTLGEADTSRISSATMGRWMTALLGLAENGQWQTPRAPTGATTYDLGQPFLLYQLDQNLGQDIFTLGLAGLTELADPKFEQRWVKASIFGDAPPDMPQEQVVKR